MHKDGSKKQTLSRAGKRIFIVKGYFTCTYKDSSKRRQPFHSKNLEIYIPGGTKNTQKKTCIDLLKTWKENMTDGDRIYKKLHME